MVVTRLPGRELEELRFGENCKGRPATTYSVPTPHHQCWLLLSLREMLGVSGADWKVAPQRALTVGTNQALGVPMASPACAGIAPSLTYTLI